MASRQDNQYLDFFSTFLSLPLNPPSETRPFVTLTFAQSLDGRIAGKDGQQLILSGDESMTMTHWLRTIHNGIMIGIGTALNDDPQLNVRRLPPKEAPYDLPQPIIMDTSLRLNPTCRLLKNFQQGIGRQPWLICLDAFTDEILQRRQVLEAAGAKVIPIPAIGNSGKLSLETVLTTLRSLGIQSLMVEGGQRIITSFLSATAIARESHLVDSLIITVAPTFVGRQGISALSDETSDIPKLDHVSSRVFGKDTVIACRIGSGLLSS